MVQRGSRTSFAEEPFAELDVVTRGKLQRNRSTQFSVLGPVTHTRAALAELVEDAVVRDGLADHTSVCSSLHQAHFPSEALRGLLPVRNVPPRIDNSADQPLDKPKLLTTIAVIPSL